MSIRDTFIKDLCGFIIYNKRLNKVTKLAIDGVDGAGKTTLADELAIALEKKGEQVIRASIDGFHNPQKLRYAMGRNSSSRCTTRHRFTGPPAYKKPTIHWWTKTLFGLVPTKATGEHCCRL